VYEEHSILWPQTEARQIYLTHWLRLGWLAVLRKRSSADQVIASAPRQLEIGVDLRPLMFVNQE